jgi:glycerophosphoryl diester phosphodiesterase
LHGGGIPENSLAAFDSAIEIGAGIECDVRLSGDGSVVVFHDSDLSRLCNVALDVERTRTSLLTGQRLAGTDQYIPLLWQVLQVVGERVPLLLELKTRNKNAASLCREVLLDVAPKEGAIGVMSFDPQVGRWFKKNGRHVQRGLVIRDSLPPWRRSIALWLADPDFVAVERTALAKPWVSRIRERMPVYSWTIRTADQRSQAQVHADALIWEGDGRPRN